MSLTFKDRDTPLSTIFSQLLIREQGQCCKLKMLICITNVSVVFPSSPGFISVVFPMSFLEVYICLSTASNMSSKFTMSHPSLVRAPCMRNMKHWLLFYFKSNKMFISH